MISKNTMAMPPMISQRRFDRRRPPSAPEVDAGLDPAVIGGAASGAAGAGGIDAGAEPGSMRGSPLSATLPSLALPIAPRPHHTPKCLRVNSTQRHKACQALDCRLVLGQEEPLIRG